MYYLFYFARCDLFWNQIGIKANGYLINYGPQFTRTVYAIHISTYLTAIIFDILARLLITKIRAAIDGWNIPPEIILLIVSPFKKYCVVACVCSIFFICFKSKRTFAGEENY